MSVEQVVEKLFDIGAVKFGEFTLKSGITSPFYIDLRLIISYPDLLQQISELMWMKMKSLQFNLICGVPYTALPVATCISIHHKVPMVMRRKEEKTYGTRKCIEGIYNQDGDSRKDVCVIIEDLVTSGTSIVETHQALTNVGIDVKDAIVLIDREQGGEKNLQIYGINLHSVTTITQMLQILLRSERLKLQFVNKVEMFLKENQCVALNLPSNTTTSTTTTSNNEQKEMQSEHSNISASKNNSSSSSSSSQSQQPSNEKASTTTSSSSSKKLSLEARLEMMKNKVAKKLVQIMINKKTCLCVAADVTTCAELLKLADAIGPFICILKTHVDILTDFDKQFLVELKALANKHQFLIFEDRKFADIGNTVKYQFAGGVYNMVSWADIINCHTIPGPGIIDGLKEASIESVSNKEENVKSTVNHGLLLLAEMSSEKNLATPEYTQNSVMFGEHEKYQDFVIGFISMGKVSNSPTLLHMTPGVNLQMKGDNLGQQYMTPEHVIGEKGSDVIIVGRGIYHSKDPAKSAKEYQDQSWQAYLKSLQ